MLFDPVEYILPLATIIDDKLCVEENMDLSLIESNDILLRDDGKVICSNEVQSANEHLSMLVTPSGISRRVRELQPQKQLWPIDVRETDGSWALKREEHPMKDSGPSEVIPVKMVTFFSCETVHSEMTSLRTTDTLNPLISSSVLSVDIWYVGLLWSVYIMWKMLRTSFQLMIS